MARLLRCVAVVALVGGATASLTACSGDPGPIVTETPSPTRTVEATPSPSPTPTVTSEEELLARIPEDARGEDFASASNFAKFFINEYYVMLSTGEDSLFRAMSEPECDFCASALDEFDEAVGSGGSVVGGEMTFDKGLTDGGYLGDGTTNASFGIAVAEVEYLDANGAVYKSVPATHGRVGVLMRFEMDRWVVVGVAHEEG